MIPRLRTVLLSLALIVASALAGQAAAAPAPAGDASPGPTAAAAESQATEARRRKRKRRRPGCGRFCRQAGGFGAGPEQEHPVDIKRQTVRVDRWGVIGIRATCRLEIDCDGAILVDRFEVSYGRADLFIPAGKTRTVYVAVPRKGRRFLARKGRDRKAFATVPLKSQHPVSFSPRITLLPRR